MKKYVELDSLWDCKTCFHYRNDRCSPIVWCDSGESYRPAYDKLKIVEGEIVKTAHWEISSDGYYPYCSNCKNSPKHGEMTKYCPECGAAMANRKEGNA